MANCSRLSAHVASKLVIVLALAGPGQVSAGERSPESREKLARAERTVNDLLDAVRRVRATKTPEEWHAEYGKMCDLEDTYRQMVSKVGAEALEAFENAVLKDVEEWDRLSLFEVWPAYLSAAALDCPDMGRKRINQFLQAPKLTARMRAQILDKIPPSSQPEEWLEERFVLNTVLEMFAHKAEYCRMASPRSDPGAKPDREKTTLRFCDLGLQIAYWFAPADVARVGFSHVGFAERDQAIVDSRKWVEARLRLLELRSAVLGTIKDYRLLRMDREQLNAAFALWGRLDKRQTLANFRDMKTLADCLFTEMKERRDTGRKADELDRCFQREIIRALQELFKSAGGDLRGSKGNEMDVPGSALLWIHDAALEAAKNANSPFLRQEWRIFAGTL